MRGNPLNAWKAPAPAPATNKTKSSDTHSKSTDAVISIENTEAGVEARTDTKTAAKDDIEMTVIDVETTARGPHNE